MAQGLSSTGEVFHSLGAERLKAGGPYRFVLNRGCWYGHEQILAYVIFYMFLNDCVTKEVRREAI